MDDNKLSIAVCGESFCTACLQELKYAGRRAHFSDILEDCYGYKILHFAHGGFSNTGIFFQIQEALKHNPDVVVYNKTWNSRLDIKINDPFQPYAGLKNFLYYNDHMPSTHESWAGKTNAAILSIVPHGLEHNKLVSSVQLNAIKEYMVHVFDYDLQKIKDDWLF